MDAPLRFGAGCTIGIPPIRKIGNRVFAIYPTYDIENEDESISYGFEPRT
jgi:hypothetical protein